MINDFPESENKLELQAGAAAHLGMAAVEFSSLVVKDMSSLNDGDRKSKLDATARQISLAHIAAYSTMLSWGETLLQSNSVLSADAIEDHRKKLSEIKIIKKNIDATKFSFESSSEVRFESSSEVRKENFKQLCHTINELWKSLKLPEDPVQRSLTLADGSTGRETANGTRTTESDQIENYKSKINLYKDRLRLQADARSSWGQIILASSAAIITVIGIILALIIGDG